MNQPAEDYLEKALSAAFAAADGASPSRSGTAAAPRLAPAKVPERIGRYPVASLVGRGGIGLVLRARDAEIGRDVAVKILHDHLAGDPEMVRRFIEEARVGGGLEHPGVVPVHEMGHTDDGRPYFTMKLVEGETLASRLAARGRPDEDRAKFLAQFERLCQIVAYAHARGVVHRDLKPANVLLGAFGEVLVTDWGFATQGPATDAPSGKARIVGTPAYMSPEQARGDASRIGPRTDVFALGAVLCEILTGAPPYEADSANEILLAASRSWLDEAWKRLDGCGADARLVALARRCLAPDPLDRPADGGAVAAEIEAYLRSLEEHARTLAIEAAEARTRAQAERRQRRLMVAFGVVVLVALTAAGFARLSFERSRALRLAEDERLVAGIAERARTLAERARALTEPEPAAWEAAVANAREAAGLAAERGLPPAVRGGLDALVAAVAAGQAAASANARLVHELLAIHERAGDAREAGRRDRDYGAAFRRAGIDVESMDVAAAADLIRSSPIRKDIVAAFDDWAYSRTTASTPADASKLVAIVNAADPDAWRVRVRTAATSGDAAALEAIAAASATDGDSAESQLLLAQCLRRAGRRDAAIAVLDRAQIRHSGDYELHHQLGILWRDGPQARLREAIRQFSMALALRPGNAHAIVDLAQALLQAGDLDAAERHLEEALRIEPSYAPVHHYLGVVDWRHGRLGASESRIARALDLDPGFANGSLVLALVRREAGRFEEAATGLRDAVAREPLFAEAWAELGHVLIALGRFDEARVAFTKAHETGSARGARWTQPSAGWLADIEVLIGAARELEELGGELPVDATPAQAANLARAAWFLGRAHMAARIFEFVLAQASASTPIDPGFLTIAARAAVGAGTGSGREPAPDDERQRWRATGREWLDRALDGIDRLEDAGTDRAILRGILDGVRRDPAFTPVRDPTLRTAIPPAERDAWAALWDRVAAASKRLSAEN